MGNLIFTKQYSSTDNGSKVSGANLGQLETDIAAILNGGITNVNINASAGIVESKLAFDTTSGHNHDGSNSRTLSTGGQRGFVQGAWLNYVAADQIKADSGVIEIAGSLYTRTSYSTTIDTDTAGHWVEGVSQRAINTWAYVYAYNDSGSTWDIKYWLQAPQYANTGTDDSSVKIYRQNASVWYRCLGAVRMDAVGSGNILNFYQINDFIMWDIPISITTAVSAGAWSAAKSCATAMPAISTFAKFGGSSTHGASQSGFHIRPNGGTWATGAQDGYVDQSSNQVTGQLDQFTDSSQQIQYYNDGGDTATAIDLLGYRLSIR